MANQQKLMGKFLGATKITKVGEKEMLLRKFYVDISDNPEYPNTPEFQLTGEKVTIIDELKAGDLVEVSFSINGMKYTNKTTGAQSVMTNLRAYKVTKFTKGSEASAIKPETMAVENEEVELPF